MCAVCKTARTGPCCNEDLIEIVIWATDNRHNKQQTITWMCLFAFNKSFKLYANFRKLLTGIGVLIKAVNDFATWKLQRFMDLLLDGNKESLGSKNTHVGHDGAN